ncbi:MAG: aspartyl protease family protein [Cyclobacteriaceae bacterium]|nr:aspartyl protease family protein [Cyclobacteriaceae bacterium]
MINRIFILLILVLSLFGTSCFGQQLGFRIPDGVKKVKIPFQFHHNLVVIPVILNNLLPLKFILDTGVRTTILTERTYSDILNLNYDKHVVISGAGGEKLVDAYITSGVTLEIPGVKGEGHAILVLENDYIELSNFLGTQVNGILGYEVFSRFIVNINFETKMITLIKPEFFRPKKKYTKMPITIEDTKPYILVNVEQKEEKSIELKLMIDTGASHGLLIEEESHKDIYLPSHNINSNIGRGLAGDLKGKIGRLNSLSLGNYEFKQVITTFPEINTYTDSLKRDDVYRNGTIGGEIMSRFNLIFDYSAGNLYLKKNSRFKEKFEYNISGVIIKATGAFLQDYVIDDVRIGSSAEKAGLHKGDKILSVNNTDVVNAKLGQVIGYFNSKHNKLIKVEIERNGNVYKKKFRLERQI